VIQEEEIDIMIVKLGIGIITDTINRIIEIIIRIVIKESMMIVMMKETIRKRKLVKVRLLIRKMIKKNNINHLLRIDLMRKMEKKVHLRKKEKGKEVGHRKESKAVIQMKMMT